jgi:pimeloyl-ACP methyl ester carboxylesterase
MPITHFSLPVSESALKDLRERVTLARWPDEICGSGWEYGAELSFMKEICAYWKNTFDWKKELEELSRFQHFRYESGGFGIHFIHERGKGSNALPLILTHGWPGSFLEFEKIIPMLTDPQRHGGRAEDSFDVVVPSLPGFGYSDRPSEAGLNTFRIGELFLGLMSELGYERFGAQGGDFGANVSTVMSLRAPERVIGLHLNYIPGSYWPHVTAERPITSEEQAAIDSSDHWEEVFGGYMHVQATEPQTLAYALNDSPVGLATWIIEKFKDWADCDGDVYRRFTRDELLTNVTLYWMTETIHSSCRLYFESSRAPLRFGPDDFVRVPTAVAHFPKEDPFPPRSWVERGYDVRHWTKMPSGGHFAAAEEPELLARDLREFFRPLRGGESV